MPSNRRFVTDKPKRGFHPQVLPNQVYEDTRRDETLYVKDGYHLEPCCGEAHSKPMEHDHCMYCLSGTWGWALKQDRTLADRGFLDVSPERVEDLLVQIIEAVVEGQLHAGSAEVGDDVIKILDDAGLL